MTITQLIDNLQEALVQHGDIAVKVNGNPVEYVEVVPQVHYFKPYFDITEGCE